MKRKTELIDKAISLGIGLYVEENRNGLHWRRLKTKGELEWDIQLAEIAVLSDECNAETRSGIFLKQVLTEAEKAKVTPWNHYTVKTTNPDWAQAPEYQNFRNAEGCLCGYVQVRDEPIIILSTTVY